jgi:YVTN family beta-propeller protein
MTKTLARDWRKAAWFYARFGITEGQFRLGVPLGATRYLCIGHILSELAVGRVDRHSAKSHLPTLLAIAIVAAITASALGSVPASGGVRGVSGSPSAGVAPSGNAGPVTGGVGPRESSPAWEVIANVTVGLGPTGVVASYNGSDLMVTNSGSDNVSVVSAVNYTVLDSISVGSDPVAIAEGPFVGVGNLTEEFYVANEGSNNITVIDNWSVAGSIPVGQGPDGLAYNSSSGLLYVANLDSDNVTLVNSTSVVASIPVGLGPAGIAWNPANGYVYVANSGSNNVSVLDGTAVIGAIPVGVDPTAVWYYRWYGDVEVSDTGSNNVSWISGLSLRTSFPVGVGPAGGVYLQGISADAGEGPVFVANSGSDNVTVLNGTVQLQSVPVLSDPTGIALTGTYYLYVTDTGSDEVSVITQLVPEPKYQIQFSENGLPPSTDWSVTMNGTAEQSNSSVLEFSEPNGTYPFSVGAVAGFSPSEASGSIQVNGASVNVSIDFSPNPPDVFVVAFQETGLRPATNWAVTLAGVVGRSNSSFLNFSEPNGSYPYTVSNQTGYSIGNRTGVAVVDGAPISVAVTFVGKCYGYCRGFPVTFSESGLPSGTNWTVLINGSTLSGTGSFSTQLRNGSYAWEITLLPSGEVANPSQGTLVVNGGPVTVSVTFAPSGPATHLGPTLEPTPLWVWILIAAIIIAVAAAVVFWVRGRRTSPPEKP